MVGCLDEQPEGAFVNRARWFVRLAVVGAGLSGQPI
jgi:hypothetical protein